MNEFNRIAHYLAPLSAGHAGAWNLKDDVALLEAHPLVISTDTIVEGVHYIGDEPADLIARKLLRCNLSDLAAKGATPLYYTLNLTLHRGQGDDWLAAFCKGLAQDQARFGLTLIGGDSTVIADGACVLSLTIYGRPQRELPRRNDAKVGDLVCVSGSLGDAAIGLRLAQGQLTLDDPAAAAHLLGRYQLPEPRIELGRQLAPLVGAAMDISDGLVQDAGHIAKASDVAIELYADKLPVSLAAKLCIDQHLVGIEDIATGGDDYEILCSLPQSHWQHAANLASKLKEGLTIIGRVTEGNGVVLLNHKSQPMALEKSGFAH